MGWCYELFQREREREIGRHDYFIILDKFYSWFNIHIYIYMHNNSHAKQLFIKIKNVIVIIICQISRTGLEPNSHWIIVILSLKSWNFPGVWVSLSSVRGTTHSSSIKRWQPLSLSRLALKSMHCTFLIQFFFFYNSVSFLPVRTSLLGWRCH